MSNSNSESSNSASSNSNSASSNSNSASSTSNSASSNSKKKTELKIPKALEITIIVLVSLIVVSLTIYLLFFHGKDVRQIHGDKYNRFIKRTTNPYKQQYQKLPQNVKRRLQNSPKAARLMTGYDPEKFTTQNPMKTRL